MRWILVTTRKSGGRKERDVTSRGTVSVEIRPREEGAVGLLVGAEVGVGVEMH